MSIPKLKRTLYIGLGGTGFKTLLHTKKAFIETYGEVPPMIKFLVFDSDQNQYKSYVLPSIYGEIKFDPAESSDICIHSSASKVARNRNQLTWLPDRNLRAVEDLANGCGMVRTNGRLAFAFNELKSRSAIQNALNQIRNLHSVAHNDRYDLISNDVEVNLVFSIAGGTGSGTFLDMAYLVKDIFHQQGLPETSKIVGYMVLPDVYDAQLTFGKERLFPNAVGSLMDLDYMMHFDFTHQVPVNYLTAQRTLTGSPFNSVIAISNTNTEGHVVDNADDLAQMMSLAMVVSAGELSSGVASVANNLERDTNAGAFDLLDKRAIIGTVGMSEITFRATDLSRLFAVKAARETAAAILDPGSNADTDANNWIDTMQIRENNGQDQVIDYLLKKLPVPPFSEIYDKANPRADINSYLTQSGVAPDNSGITERINKKEKEVKAAFDTKIRTTVNTRGPVYAIDLINQIRNQIDICMGEMRDELAGFEASIATRESAISTAIEDFKGANGKIFGRARAIAEAKDLVCAAVNAKTITIREIARRNGAITFYTWFLQILGESKDKLKNIESAIRSACAFISRKISEIDHSLRSTRGLFEVDLTQPYVDKVTVARDSVNVNQFVISLKDNVEIYGFDKLTPEEIADHILRYTATLSSGGQWTSMSAEDALKALSTEEAEAIIRRAVALSSPMCPVNFRGHINKELNNYYYVGVQEQSSTRLNGSPKDDHKKIIDFKACLPAGEMHETNFASIGSPDRIVIYHQYGVFPTFAIGKAESYRHAYEAYMQRPTAFSCFMDEDQRVAMERSGFSVLPKEQTDDSMELWVKGLIFGLIRRDEQGNFQYRDETNKEMALFDYWTSLGTQYRDEAFRNFRRIAPAIRSQFEQFMVNRTKAEGQAAIDSILADARINYMARYSLNDLEASNYTNPLYKGIVKQLTDEKIYIDNEL